MKRKFLSLLMVLSLCLSGCMPALIGPKNNPTVPSASSQVAQAPEPVPTPQQVTSLTLPYNSNDPLNPYTLKTQRNRLLVPLLYDSLTRPDRQWKPENQLATEISTVGNVYTIRWRDDARFSDGSYLTGKDIVYSFQTAMAPGTPWTETLTNISSITTQDDDKTVSIGLLHPDVDFPALLSFPIIKQDSNEMEYPIGISKFYMTGAHNTGIVLTRNPIYYGKETTVASIKLVHAADNDSLQFNMSTGEIDMLYNDLLDSSFTTVNAPSNTVSVNRLVYVGINAGRGLLAKPEFRHALSLALNRAEIAMTAYTGYARASAYPFHPDFYRLEGIDVSATRNLSAADALLDGIGLTEKNDMGQRTQQGQPVTLRLLVNSENSNRNGAATLVVEQLASVGIKVEVTSGSFEQYQTYLRGGQFDLYIGETLLMDNMDFNPLLSSGRLGYNTAYSKELDERVAQYRETGEIKPLCDMFLAQSPFLPLVYRNSLLYTTRDFGAEVLPTHQDLFYNILDW